MPSSEPRQLLAALAKAEKLRDPFNQGGGKRQYRRFVIRGDAELHPMDGDRLDQQPVSVMLRDIGRGGVGFVVQQRLPNFSTWRISFLSHGHVVGQQALIVRHCEQVQQGVFLVGSQFCIETGLLCLLGVDPAVLDQSDQSGRDTDGPATFLTPGEVA